MNLVETIARSLVDLKEAVRVERVPSPNPDGICFRVHADPSDVGRLIGKQGRTARSMRTVVAMSGRRDGLRVALDIPSAGVE